MSYINCIVYFGELLKDEKHANAYTNHVSRPKWPLNEIRRSKTRSEEVTDSKDGNKGVEDYLNNYKDIHRSRVLSVSVSIVAASICFNGAL